MSMDPEERKMLHEIHTAMVGNNLGTTGVIKRMEAVEEKASNNKKTINNIKSTSTLYGAGAGTGITGIWLLVKAWITTKMGG